MSTKAGHEDVEANSSDKVVGSPKLLERPHRKPDDCSRVATKYDKAGTKTNNQAMEGLIMGSVGGAILV